MRNEERLKAALDERGQLTAAYRRSKRSQFERAYEAEPRLRSFAADIRRCTIDDAGLMISLTRSHHGTWLRNTDDETRALALEIVSTRIRQIRERAGLMPFDDPLWDEPPDVFQTVKRILA